MWICIAYSNHILFFSFLVIHLYLFLYSMMIFLLNPYFSIRNLDHRCLEWRVFPKKYFFNSNPNKLNNQQKRMTRWVLDHTTITNKWRKRKKNHANSISSFSTNGEILLQIGIPDEYTQIAAAIAKKKKIDRFTSTKRFCWGWTSRNVNICI